MVNNLPGRQALCSNQQWTPEQPSRKPAILPKPNLDPNKRPSQKNANQSTNNTEKAT